MSISFRKGRLIRALFEILKDNPDGLAAKDAIAMVREKVELAPQEEGSFEKTGQEKFPSIVRFATIPTTKVGWMVKDNGTWTVTDLGLKALEELPEPEELYKSARDLANAQKGDSPGSDASVESEDLEEEVSAATSLEEDEDAARTEIIEYLGKMPPFDFQTICAKVVAALGHEIAWISPPGPDGGLDFVAYADPIGATGRRIKGQAKRQQSKQDVSDVGAFMAKLSGDDAGVFIALGGFTKNAEADARADARRLMLLDGGDLVRLWIEHYDRLDEEARALLRLRPVWRLVTTS